MLPEENSSVFQSKYRGGLKKKTKGSGRKKKKKLSI